MKHEKHPNDTFWGTPCIITRSEQLHSKLSHCHSSLYGLHSNIDCKVLCKLYKNNIYQNNNAWNRNNQSSVWCSDLNLFVFRNKCTYCGSDIETSFTPIGRRILWWLIQTKIFAFFRNTECHSLLPARHCNLLFSEGKKMCVLRQSCHMKKEILLKHQSAQTFFIFYFPCFLALCNYCIYMFKRQFLIVFQFKN